MQTTFESVSVEERRLAILAHGSILLSFLISVTTGGVGVLATILIPFFIWLLYRDRSAYVAFHAMQATVYQLALVVIFLALVGVLAAILGIAWVVTGLLSLILIGLLLVPIATVLTIAASAILALYPLAGLAYGLTATWQVYNSGDFRYEWIANWLENRI